MLQSLVSLDLSKRLPIFIAVATLAGFLALWGSLKIVFPEGAVPQLKGYCCEYCENGTACTQAAIGDPSAVKSTVCKDIDAYKDATGTKLDVPIEPWDTWSNVAYIVIALIPLAHKQGFKGFAPVFTIVALILGFGSGLFHASGTAWGELADVFGMFIVFGFLAAVSILILLDKLNLLTLIILTASLTWLEFFLRSVSGDVAALGVIAVLSLVPLIISSKGQPHRIRILWGFLIFIVAIAFRQLDGTFCGIFGEHSIIQGHAIWHVISAFGIGYIFWLQHEIAEGAGELD